MNPRDIQKSGYDFAKKQEEKQVKILKRVSLILPIIILLFLCLGFVKSIDFFAKKEESVDRIFIDEQKETEEKIQRAETIKKAYENAKIPYTDPKGRYSIIFLTPYVSSEIAVVINSEKEYDNSKKEADEIVQNAKQKVNITSVSYIKNY